MAHWVQILNTAHALACEPGVAVWLMPAVLRARPEDVLVQFGLRPTEALQLRGLAPAWAVRGLGLREDFFHSRQKRAGKWLARVAFRRAFSEARERGGPIVVLTREQHLPSAFAKVLSAFRGEVRLICESHEFEYSRTLKKRHEEPGRVPGTPSLGEWTRQGRAERAAEWGRLDRFDGIVCTTKPIEAELRRSGFGRPTLWLPNGAKLLEGETSPAPRDGAEILYVGQLFRWKNVDLLIEALAQLPGRRLTIVGGNRKSDRSRVEELAQRLGVTGRVTFTGQVPHREVAGYLRGARVGVIPLPRAGYREARLFCCPLKAFEMMAEGLPIVATRLPALEGILEHDRTAWLVEPDDAAALAGGLRRLLEDEPLRTRLAAAARERMPAFTYGARARQILEFAATLGARSAVRTS